LGAAEADAALMDGHKTSATEPAEGGAAEADAALMDGHAVNSHSSRRQLALLHD